MTPPVKLLEFYTGAENRGYLADPSEVAKAKLTLAQKYGYTLSSEQLDGDNEAEWKTGSSFINVGYLGMEGLNKRTGCYYQQ